MQIQPFRHGLLIQTGIKQLHTKPQCRITTFLYQEVGDNSKFFAGFGIRKQDGIVIYTNENKYTARFNSEFTFLDGRVKVGENFTTTYSTNLGVTNLGEGSPISMGAYREQPIIPVTWTGADFGGISHTFTAGDWAGTGISTGLGNATNPVASLTRGKDNINWDMRSIASGYVDVKILQGLNFKIHNRRYL